VIRDFRGRARACYVEGSKKHPDLEGSVTLVIKVGADGKVLAVSGGGTPKLAPIIPCLKKEAQDIEFPPPKDGAAVLHIPLTFVKP